jgi:hypothetical protein
MNEGSKVVRLTYSCGCAISVEINMMMQIRGKLQHANWCPIHAHEIRRKMLFEF